jgi:hypothetical protein
MAWISLGEKPRDACGRNGPNPSSLRAIKTSSEPSSVSELLKVFSRGVGICKRDLPVDAAILAMPVQSSNVSGEKEFVLANFRVGRVEWKKALLAAPGGPGVMPGAMAGTIGKRILSQVARLLEIL